MITETIASQDNEEEIDVYDVGSRHLKDEQIEHLRHTLEPLYDFHAPKSSFIEAVSTKLAELLKNEDINYESSLNLFAQLKADITLLQSVYTTKIEEDNVTFLDVIEMDFGEKESKKLWKQLLRFVKRPRYEGTICSDIGSDEQVIIDPIQKKIKHVSVNIKNNRDMSKEKTIVEVYPKELTVYDSPLEDEPRKFEVLWDTALKDRPFRKGPKLMEELIMDLEEEGYVIGHRHVKDVLPAALNAYIREGLATIKTEIETPGFFYDGKEQKILNIKYDIEKPPKEEIEQAISILEELAGWFEGQETKLATVFKWGLVAPFIFARKQLGSWIPWLYLYGKAQSGKTTMAMMVIYMWDKPTPDNSMNGGSFDTVARVGNRLSQSTFPLVINEPAGAFSRVSVVEVLKSAVESTSCRGKYEGRSYRTIPSYAPVAFTANHYIPDDDALMRRLYLLTFTHNEAKAKDVADKFEDAFQIKSQTNCKFNAFKAITQVASQELMGEPDMLDMDWKELANSLLIRIYSDVGKRPPEWLLGWSKSETMADLDEEHREDVRIFLLNEINRAFGRVQVMDEEYRPVQEKFDSDPNVKKVDHFKARVWTVINERLVPWMIPYNVHDTDYVCLTIGFKKELHKELKICQPLKGVAELMGWDYQAVRIPNPQKVIKVSFKKFMDFLYPTGQ